MSVCELWMGSVVARNYCSIADNGSDNMEIRGWVSGYWWATCQKWPINTPILILWSPYYLNHYQQYCQKLQSAHILCASKCIRVHVYKLCTKHL